MFRQTSPVFPESSGQERRPRRLQRFQQRPAALVAYLAALFGFSACSIGRLGAAACTMRSQHLQASFARTCRITWKCARMRSNTFDRSSPGCVVLRRNRDSLLTSAGGFVFLLADATAADVAPTRPIPSWRLTPAEPQRSPPRSFSTLPAATPTARSADPVFPRSARTACAAVRSAALNVRFPDRVKPAARVAKEFPVGWKRPAHATPE
jgi:hypothetical protein